MRTHPPLTSPALPRADGTFLDIMAEQETKSEFDPADTNSTYDQFATDWITCRDFAEMHEHILRDGTYLDRFGAGTGTQESQSQYDWRKQSSFVIDACDELIDLRIGNLFRTTPQRNYEESPYKDFIGTFLADVDGGGTGMDDFMQTALRKHYATGVDFVVDKTPGGEDAETRKQEIDSGAQPYVSMFTPLERIDWACEHSGKYKWARYSLGTKAAESEEAGDGGQQYLTMTPDSWTLWTVIDEEATKLTGDLAIGTIPIVQFYWRRSGRPEYRGVPISLLTKIAPIARALLNLISQGQLDIYMAIGVLAAIGVDADQLPKEMAPMCWVALPDGASVDTIVPEVGHIAEKRNWINLLMLRMLSLGKVISPSFGDSSKGRASSGLQVAAERTDLDNELAATAGQLEQVEKDIIRLAVSRMEGKPVDHGAIGYSVEYNRRYVLANTSEIIEQAKSMIDLGTVPEEVPTLMRTQLKRLAGQFLKPDTNEYQAVMDEIDKADFGAIPADTNEPEVGESEAVTEDE